MSAALEIGPPPGTGDGGDDRAGKEIRYKSRYDLPHGELGRWYYPKLFRERAEDTSFTVFKSRIQTSLS